MLSSSIEGSLEQVSLYFSACILTPAFVKFSHKKSCSNCLDRLSVLSTALVTILCGNIKPLQKQKEHKMHLRSIKNPQ